MKKHWKILIHLGLPLLLLLCWSSSALAENFIQDYWETNSDPAVVVLGETLADPIFTLSDETFTLDVASIQTEDEWDGYGLYFSTEDNTDDATVTLTSGTDFEVIVPVDGNLRALTGISLIDFDEATVSLSGASHFTVAGSGQDISTTGFFLQHSVAVETAEILIDGGSAVQVTATAVDADVATPDVRAVAYGAVLNDNVHDKVTIRDGSTMNVAASATSESDSTWTQSTGIDASSFEGLIEITLEDKSTLSSTATATSSDGYDADASSIGIDADGYTVKVSLLDGSSVTAQAISTGFADSTGIDVSYDDTDYTIDHGEVTLDGASRVSSIATATGDDSYADSIGVEIRAASEKTAKLVMKDNSVISAQATGSAAEAIGSLLGYSPHIVADINTGSSIEATATAGMTSNEEDDFITASASAIGIQGRLIGDVDEGDDAVELTLNDASITTVASATATQTGSGSAEAEVSGMTSGIFIQDYQTAAIDLTTTTISVTADAIASASDGVSTASVFPSKGGILSGMTVYDGGATAISFDDSSIDVVATATADVSEVWAAGVKLIDTDGDKDDETPLISLVNSSISVSSSAIGADESSVAVAAGIWADENDVEEGMNTIILDNSTITATAAGSDSNPIGIYTEDGGNYIINLENNSRIQAVQNGDYAEEKGNAAIVVGADVEINVDSTSALIGDWAVLAIEPSLDFGMEPYVTATLRNNGLVAGRLDIDTLDNSATGVLQATFGADDSALSDDGISYFKNSDGIGFGSSYFTVNDVATLADGTTFRIVPIDNLGLSEIGDSQSYALLETETGDWTQANLKLTSPSSMLGFSWDEDASDENHLVVTATVMTLEEAGLSDNAIAAFGAAVEDDVFSFDSDPEEWVPDVSGAFVAGMTNTLGASTFGIGRRLGAIMGMNSGDDLIAGNGLWINARYTDTDQGMRDGIVGFDADNTGFTMGFDREFGSMIIGIAYTRGDTDADADDNSTQFDMTDHLFSLYGNYDGGSWYTDVIIAAGFGSVDELRRVGTDVYSSNYDSSSYNAKVEAGMKFNQQGFQIVPVVTAEYSAKDYDSYTESGTGSYALHVESQDYEVFTVGAGVVANYAIPLNRYVVTPEISGAVNYDITNDQIVSTANFVGGSTSFVAEGIEPADTSWDLGVALTIGFLEEQNLSLRLSYDYSGRQDYDAHSIAGKLRYEF